MRDRSRHNNVEWQRVSLAARERDGHVCRYCGRYGDTADHVDPADPATLVVCACRSCNSRKARRSLSQWVASGEAPPGAFELWRRLSRAQ